MKRFSLFIIIIIIILSINFVYSFCYFKINLINTNKQKKQVLKEILKNKEDKTKVSLIFANISEEDILLKKELDLLASLYDNFKVYYTLDRPSENWTQGKGFISEEMIKENLSEPSDDKMVFVCGPDPMVRFIAGAKGPNYTQGDLTGLLAKLGYTQDQVYKF